MSRLAELLEQVLAALPGPFRLLSKTELPEQQQQHQLRVQQLLQAAREVDAHVVDLESEVHDLKAELARRSRRTKGDGRAPSTLSATLVFSGKVMLAEGKSRDEVLAHWVAVFRKLDRKNPKNSAQRLLPKLDTPD
jgi:hypothetical protein